MRDAHNRRPCASHSPGSFSSATERPAMTKPPLRLRRLLAPPSQHAFFLTFTAGLEIGVIPGMTDIPGIVSAFADTGKVSAVVVHAGVVESLFRKRPDLPCGVIVDLFGGTLVSTRPE